jgi:hypothetical protein
MIHVPRPTVLCAGLSAAALVACGSLSSGPPAPPTAWISQLEALNWAPDREVDSIPAFRIDSFKVVDADRVLIHSGVDRSYLVTLGGACSGLGSARRLGYTTADGALTRADKLIVVGPQGASPCAVVAIHSLRRLPLAR